MTTDRAGGPGNAEQRRLVDTAIRAEGIEWDQPRIGFTLRPIGVDGTFDLTWVRGRVRKFADITPAFTAAERRERLAASAEARGHTVTAREHYFVAALLYVSAAWPIFEHSDLLAELERKKNACSLDAGGGASAAALGPNWYTYAADWLLDRVAGRPAEDVFEYVTADGRVERRPHPKAAR